MKRIFVTAILVGCSAGNSHDQPGVDAPAGTVDAPPGSAQRIIFTIVLENHDYAEIVGSSNAPYINSLIAMGGLATNYKDTNHPSLPNYLHMISGADQYPGFIDVDPTSGPYFPANQPNLGTQLETANVKWRSYQESMGTPCKLSASGTYAPKHDPFLYFVDQQMGANRDRKSTRLNSSH